MTTEKEALRLKQLITRSKFETALRQLNHEKVTMPEVKIP